MLPRSQNKYPQLKRHTYLETCNHYFVIKLNDNLPLIIERNESLRLVIRGRIGNYALTFETN